MNSAMRGVFRPAYRYEGFGLEFESELECRGFGESEGIPHAKVVVGPVPEHLPGTFESGVTFEAQPDRVLLRFPHGRFLIEHGRRITVDRDPQATPESVCSFLVVALGILLLQRGVFLMHAAACALPAGAVLLAGASGRGKSTVLGGLLARGHRLIADDVCAVVLNEQQHPMVHRAQSILKLFPDALDRVRADLGQATTIREGIRKRCVSPPVELVAPRGPHAIAGVCVLDYHSSGDVRFVVLRGNERLAHLRYHVYVPKLVRCLGLDAAQLPTAAALAGRTLVTRISRPRSLDALDQVVDAIEDHFGG